MTTNMGKCLVQDCGGRAVDTWQFVEEVEHAAVGNAVRNNMPVCGPHLEALRGGAPYTHLGDGTLLLPGHT